MTAKRAGHGTSGLGIFPFRVVLEMRHGTRLPPQQCGVVYAVLAEAAGLARGAAPELPDGVLVDAPEQCRCDLARGERYALGFRVLSATAGRAAAVAQDMAAGLARLGERGAARGSGFGGNFALVSVACTVEGARPDAPLPIPPAWVEQECALARAARALTLRFTTPLRWQRPHDARRPGGAFLDGDCFPLQVFLARARARLAGLGFDVPADEPSRHTATLLANELVWLDVGYGAPERRKTLGGAVGRVRLEVADPAWVDVLVWSQYVRLGGNTRFGFGAFRIEELPAERHGVAREQPLAALWFRDIGERAADDGRMPSGRLQQVAREVASGAYVPAPGVRALLPGDPPRVLSIPSSEDRAIQRLLLRHLAPAVDGFLESSSMAYRKGLGREQAARSIREHYRQGFRWAVRPDFHRFFDSVDHALLRRRLEACLADDAIVTVLMRWVEVDAPRKGCGLPTLAPISRLLGKLLLDGFDEAVRDDGARLVRYAGDFLLLFRHREQAEAMTQCTREAAHALDLVLSEAKTAVLPVSEPFEFLGFRFEATSTLPTAEGAEVKHLDDLGWQQVQRRPVISDDDFALAGEAPDDVSAARASFVIGPVRWIGATASGFAYELEASARRQEVPWQRVAELVVIGPPTIDSSLLAAGVLEAPLLVADVSQRTLNVLHAGAGSEDGATLVAQVQAYLDAGLRLSIARQLVDAKIANYARLARALARHVRAFEQVAEQLERHRTACSGVATVQQLRGKEGAAAALWYGSFTHGLGGGFRFERRVAPHATDPVNVLLNIGFTVLNRLAGVAIARERMAPSVGFLHDLRPGRASLSADVQEPFRYLVDRAVMRATRVLAPGDFARSPTGAHALRIAPAAMRRFIALLLRDLAVPCGVGAPDDAVPYRQHIARTARSLRRHVMDRTSRFEPFIHA